MNDTSTGQSRRATRVAIVMLALGALWNGPAPAVGEVPRPAVESPPAASVDVAADTDAARRVEEHLLRFARRTGLNEFEIHELARIVTDVAAQHDVDPDLVLAVMHVESRYDTYAVSSVHAMGLMQIMPATGEWFAPQVDVEWQGPQTLFDPEQNVRIGVAYLRLLLDRYDGDLAAALAAYNWGPGHIDRRLARGVPLPTEYPQLVLAAYEPPGRS